MTTFRAVSTLERHFRFHQEWYGTDGEDFKLVGTNDFRSEIIFENANSQESSELELKNELDSPNEVL